MWLPGCFFVNCLILNGSILSFSISEDIERVTVIPPWFVKWKISVVHLHRLLYHLILLNQRSLAVKCDLSLQYSSSVLSCKALVLIQTCCSLAAIHSTFGLLQKLSSAIWTETCPLSPLELLKRVHQSQNIGDVAITRELWPHHELKSPPTKYAPNVWMLNGRHRC